MVSTDLNREYIEYLEERLDRMHVVNARMFWLLMLLIPLVVVLACGWSGVFA